jgi:hypothetical protein
MPILLPLGLIALTLSFALGFAVVSLLFHP